MIELKTIPPNASETDVDLYMNFRVSRIIPAGSTVEITSATSQWKVPTTNVQNYVFCNI
jgi:hypothetical protein